MKELVLIDGEENPRSNEEGLFVVYTNGPFTTKWAERKLMMWSKGQWWYPLSNQRFRDIVYGWIGPLPRMPLEDI